MGRWKQRIAVGPPCSPPTDARVRDAYRGAMWKQRYRGLLDEHPNLASLETPARQLLDESRPPSYHQRIPFVFGVGIGTYAWKYDPGVIETALARHAVMIDTAPSYDSGRVELELGRVFATVSPGDTWICSKVKWNLMGYRSVIDGGTQSRDVLNIPRIDLFQIHWPSMTVPIEETLDGIAVLLARGVISRVGVCNFSAGQLYRAVRGASARGFVIASNQIRVNHVDASARDYLLGVCHELGVNVIGYSPFHQLPPRGQPSSVLSEILSWGVDVVIPRSNRISHIRENLSVGIVPPVE